MFRYIFISVPSLLLLFVIIIHTDCLWKVKSFIVSTFDVVVTYWCYKNMSHDKYLLSTCIGTVSVILIWSRTSLQGSLSRISLLVEVMFHVFISFFLYKNISIFQIKFFFKLVSRKMTSSGSCVNCWYTNKDFLSIFGT